MELDIENSFSTTKINSFTTFMKVELTYQIG